jgi:hypothetical protein
VTIYNRIEDPQTKVIKWHRTVVPKCFWRCTEEKFIVNGTVVNANVTICRIPKQNNYLERYLWEELGEEEIKSHFTLSIGDMIVKGEVDDEIDEYTAGKRSNNFLTKYKRLQGCTLISSVSDNTDGGRGAEHYLVRGN